MAKRSKYTYLDELERSQQLDRLNTREEKGKAPAGGNRVRRDDQRRKREEERKRQVFLLRISLAVAGLAVVAAIFVIIGSLLGKKPSGGEPSGIVTPMAESSSSSEPPIVTQPADSGETVPTLTPTPTPEPVLAWWEYYSEEPLPEGDIVQINSQIYTYEQMCRDLNFLRTRYADKVQVYRIGRTADDREVLDAVVGPETATRDVIVQYSMHAREYINTPLAMRQLEELLKGWDTQTWDSRTYGALLQDVRLHILPMANPDGVAISQFGFEAIRNETMRSALYDIWQYDLSIGKGSEDYTTYYQRWKANGRGVDLNRNFNQNWENTGGTPWYSSAGFPGESAASENETQAIVRLADSINCVGQIAYHSMGSVIYWDYGTSGVLHERDAQLANLVGDLTGYTLNSTIDTGQNSSGCSDYFILVRGVPAITVETGKETCPVPFEQWPDIWERNRMVLPALAGLFGTF